jgi:beta-galactosidase beta subunit
LCCKQNADLWAIHFAEEAEEEEVTLKSKVVSVFFITEHHTIKANRGVEV